VMRRATAADLTFLTELHLDPEVTRYLGGDGSPRPPEATRTWLEKTMRWYEAEDVGQFLVLRAEDDEPLGRAGFGIFEVEEVPSNADGSHTATWGPGSAAPGRAVQRVLEVGYTFAQRFWGSGFATEAARAWFAYALGEYGATEAASVIHADNAGSLRVAQKLGLEPAPLRLRMDGQPCRLFVRRRR